MEESTSIRLVGYLLLLKLISSIIKYENEQCFANPSDSFYGIKI